MKIVRQTVKETIALLKAEIEGDTDPCDIAMHRRLLEWFQIRDALDDWHRLDRAAVEYGWEGAF